MIPRLRLLKRDQNNLLRVVKSSSLAQNGRCETTRRKNANQTGGVGQLGNAHLRRCTRKMEHSSRHKGLLAEFVEDMEQLAGRRVHGRIEDPTNSSCYARGKIGESKDKQQEGKRQGGKGNGWEHRGGGDESKSHGSEGGGSRQAGEGEERSNLREGRSRKSDDDDEEEEEDQRKSSCNIDIVLLPNTIQEEEEEEHRNGMDWGEDPPCLIFLCSLLLQIKTIRLMHTYLTRLPGAIPAAV